MFVLWLPPCIHDRLHNAKPGECIWEPSLNKRFVVVVATIGHHGSCFVMLFCYLKVFIFKYKRRKVIAAEIDTSVTRGHAIAVDRTSEYMSSYGHTAMLNISVVVANDDKVSSLEPGCSMEDQTNATTTNDTLEVPVSHKNGNCTKTKATPAPKSKTNRRQKRDTAIFITLTYVVIGYAVCWIPFHVVFDVSSVCPSCVPRGVYAITFWMTYINSTINPFLYNFSTPEFRRTFRRILCRR